MKLRLAIAALDHHDKQKHEDDIKQGAIRVVLSILRSCSPFFIAKSEQVKSCCIIFLQLYRCSQERARASFCTDGSTLIATLLEVIEINYRLGKLGDPKCLFLSKDVIDKLLDVARVPLTMVSNNDDLVSSLVSNINGASGKFVMHLSMKCIASLSEHVENKQVMLVIPGLLRAVEVGSRHMDHSVREEASRILMNLAWETKNKSKILSSSVKAILTMVEDDGYMTSQSYALQTLGHLTTLTDNKIHLVDHKNGAIIRILMQIASSDVSQASASINATEIIGYLICRATALKVGSIPGLFTTLSSLACRPDGLAPVAAKAIHKMATYIHYHPKLEEKKIDHESIHTSMLQAIVTMSYGKTSGVLKYACKAYAEQVPFRHDRIQMIGHKGLLSALSMLTHDENNYVNECAKEVLISIACDVAEARKTSVEKLLRCVARKSNTLMQPRCYSPTSVMDEFHFDADFESFC